MAIFSKPVKLTYTCYEIGHCWTPYCTKATTDIAKDVFVEAIKIYGSLYLVAGILRRRGLKYYLQKFVPETLRSSIFLTINGAGFIGMFCVWRRLLGTLYMSNSAFVPSYAASLAAILFERKPRRGPLALYLTNLAIETGFRMMVERKWVTPIPHGEVYLFSLVSAVYLYLFRKENGLSSSAESLFRFFVGGAENPKLPPPKNGEKALAQGDLPKGQGQSHTRSDPSQGQTTSPAGDSQEPASSSSSSPSSSHAADRSSSGQQGSNNGGKAPSLPSSAALPPRPRSLLQGLQKSLEQLPVLGAWIKVMEGRLASMVKIVEGWPQHRCCQHNHSCLSYVIKGGSRMLAFGYGVQVAISTLSQLQVLLRRPLTTLRAVLGSKNNLKLAAFLASYSAIFRAVNCLLRWIRDKDSEVHGFIAGGLAGLSLHFYRSVTITLYAATKLVEILYFKGIETYGFPYIKCADIFIYAFSTAFIFHGAVMEPHTLRPGYWKFLLRITHNKFGYMNRRLLEPFGVNSAKIAPNHWPDYDPAFTSLVKPPS